MTMRRLRTREVGQLSLEELNHKPRQPAKSSQEQIMILEAERDRASRTKSSV